MNNKDKTKAYSKLLESAENTRKSMQKDTGYPQRGSTGINNTVTLLGGAKRKDK